MMNSNFNNKPPSFTHWLFYWTREIKTSQIKSKYTGIATKLVLSGLFLVCFSPANAALTDGLVAYWSFDNCTAKDNSGNGHDGTINGNPQCVDGTKGKAFSFNGANDSIYISESLSTDYFTFSGWFKTSSIKGGPENGNMIVRLRYYGYAIIVDYGKLSAGISNSDSSGYGFSPEKNVGDDSWHHIALAYDAINGFYLYLDGVLISNQNTGNNAPVYFETGGGYSFGQDGNHPSDYFNGTLDDIRIYNRALTAAEVTALYQQRQTSCTKVANNPCYQEVRDEITRLAKEKNIPPVIIQAIAFKESGWLHFDTQQYTLDYCVADVGLPLVKYSRACEKDGRVGIGLMQVTVFPNDSNFNQLSSDWKYNLRAGVDKLWSKWQTQRTEAPNDTGLDIDPTVIENWYYPVMWYNGENARAWDYVKSAFQYMSSEPPLNLTTAWDKVTGIKNPLGIIDMPNKENYHVKDLALKSVPIHQWNPVTGKYADITAQVLNGEMPTTTPKVIVKDNWTPFTDGFDMPFSDSPTLSQAYFNYLGTYNKVVYNGYHPGEDWLVPLNGAVTSIANGKVERTGFSSGLGYYLVIRHQVAGNDNSFYSVFYHVNKPLVSVGEKVYRGQELTTIGDFRPTTAVHLHFELRQSLPADLYANDQGKGYYSTIEKMHLDGLFIAPSKFIADNAPTVLSNTSDASALMKTYQNAGLINKTLNQYFVEKRGQFIAILMRALEKRANKTLTEASNLPYTDIPLDSGIRSSLLKACELKVLAACAGGTQTKFNPDMPITRQEALAFTIRAYEALKQPIMFDSTKANSFVDVPETNSFNQTVVKGYQVGLTSGVVDGTYRYFYPIRWVQRGEAVSFVEKLVIQLNAK